jgi:hypothetical protein
MSLIQQGLDKGLICFDEGQKYITYVCQNKRRNWSSPEEKVQAEAFLKLVLLYGYPPEQIEQFVSVKIGSDTREADIVVYSSPEHSSARIVVECKKADISEREFGQAVAQAFSYAATGTVRAKYFWVTSGIKDACFEIPEEEPRQYLSVPDIPQNGASRLARFKYAKDGGTVNGQRLFELETVTEDELTRRFRQAHDSLWGGGQLNPSDAFDELDKLIFCKIWDERKPRKPGEPYDFQIIVEERRDAKEKKRRRPSGEPARSCLSASTPCMTKAGGKTRKCSRSLSVCPRRSCAPWSATLKAFISAAPTWTARAGLLKPFWTPFFAAISASISRPVPLSASSLTRCRSRTARWSGHLLRQRRAGLSALRCSICVQAHTVKNNH